MIILLSGAMAAGKSTLARNLASYGEYVSTSAHLTKIAGTNQREVLQELGAKLCAENPNWVIELVHDNCIFDAVRSVEQVRLIEAKFPDTRIVHVHLESVASELKRRYLKRGKTEEEFLAATQHAMESNTADLKAIADVVVNTSVSTSADTAASVLRAIEKR